jgi:hypothetical protein
MKHIGVAVLVGYVFLTSTAWAQGVGSGKIIKFNVPGAGTGANQGTVAETISPDGSVAGYFIDSNGVLHGFFRSNTGKYAKFDPTGSVWTFVSQMNSQLEIVGTYADSSGVSHGFVRFPQGKITAFDAPGAGTGNDQGTSPNGINAGGEVTGVYRDSNNLTHGFLRTADGNFKTFEAPKAGKDSGQGTFAAAINDAGTIAGVYVTSDNKGYGFLRAPDGKFSTFAGQGIGFAVNSINSDNTVLAWYLSGSDVVGCLRFSDGKREDFGPIAFVGTINDAGAVTGGVDIGYFVSHGFVRAPDAKMTDFVVPGAGTEANQGTYPLAIDAAGTVTGYYTDSNFVNHGFIRE